MPNFEQLLVDRKKPFPLLKEQPVAFGMLWVQEGVSYVKFHSQYIAWVVLFLLLQAGMIWWMVAIWEDSLARKAVGWPLIPAKIGAQVGTHQISGAVVC